MKTILFAAVVGAMVSADSARATITVIDHYRLGENDPTVPGQYTTVDSSGNPLGANALAGHLIGEFEFEQFHTASYETAASGPGIPATSLNSTTWMRFDTVGDGAPYDSTQASTIATNNVGLEGWFKPEGGAPFPTMGLVYNGNQLSRGFGLFIHEGKYQAHLGGIGYIDTGVVADHQWVYFAIVFNEGVASLYLNSTTPVATSNLAPNAADPTDSFAIGSNRRFGGSAGQTGQKRLFIGEVDEVRVFEFEPGAFDAKKDLLSASVPEPSVGLTLLGGLGALTGLGRFRRVRVS